MLDVSELLHDPDFCEDFVVLRHVETLARGRTTVQQTREPATGVVQPAPGKDLERLPEADRSKETIVIYCTLPLRVGEDDGPASADGISWNGGEYEVVSVEAWGTHCKALAQRVGDSVGEGAA